MFTLWFCLLVGMWYLFSVSVFMKKNIRETSVKSV